LDAATRFPVPPLVESGDVSTQDVTSYGLATGSNSADTCLKN
jgi:hypothetical protein